MARPKKSSTNGSLTEVPGASNLALAPDAGTLTVPTITRSEAFARARALAVEEYVERKTQQQHDKAHFVEQYGRIDKIDRAYADDIRRLLVRTLAIAKHTANSSMGAKEAKITKLATTLSEVLAAVEVQLASDNVQELFGRLDESDFLQTARSYGRATKADEPEKWVGPEATKAHAFLAGITVVEDAPKTLTKKEVAKADLDMEIAARNAQEQAQRSRHRERTTNLKALAARSCEHSTRIELEQDEQFQSTDPAGEDILFLHTCALCNADVANYDGKWYTEDALDERFVDEENAAEAAAANAADVA